MEWDNILNSRTGRTEATVPPVETDDLAKEVKEKA
jgi:hypothetical protein